MKVHKGWILGMFTASPSCYCTPAAIQWWASTLANRSNARHQPNTRPKVERSERSKLHRKPKIKHRALYLDLCTGRRSNCSTYDHRSLSVYLSVLYIVRGWGGGERVYRKNHIWKLANPVRYGENPLPEATRIQHPCDLFTLLYNIL